MHTVDIDSFVPLMEIDKRYLDEPYYIAPEWFSAMVLLPTIFVLSTRAFSVSSRKPTRKWFRPLAERLNWD
jgi:hypothetical protein